LSVTVGPGVEAVTSIPPVAVQSTGPGRTGGLSVQVTVAPGASDSDVPPGVCATLQAKAAVSVLLTETVCREGNGLVHLIVTELGVPVSGEVDSIAIAAPVSAT
jgi:hypothetical protein